MRRLAPAIVLVVAAALLPGSAQAAAKRCGEPGARWERATPAESGIDAAKIADAVRYASDNNSVAVRVYRYGCLVAEDSLNPEGRAAPGQSFSLAKSVVSLTFGRAWTLGLMGPDDPVGSFFDEADAIHGKVLVRHLATMTSGAALFMSRDFNLGMHSRVRDMLTLPFAAEPGKTWTYFQTGVATLAATVTRAVGEDFQAFAQRELFSPIGIRPGSWAWIRDGAGDTQGFWGLNMTPDDFGRLGEVLRRDGVWKGKRLLSQQYVREAVQLTKPFGCYGMLIWRQATPRCNWPVFLGLPEDMWQFNGAQGQLVTAFPSLGLMTVRTGTDPSNANWAASAGGDSQMTTEREFHDRVLRAITDTPVNVVRKPRDRSKPSAAEQQRGAEDPSKEPGGALDGAVQPPLPPAGPARARAVLLPDDDLPVRIDRKGRAAVRLRCPPVWPSRNGACRGTLLVKKHGRAPVAFDVAPGKAAVVRVRLTPAALRRTRPFSLSLRAATRDATASGTLTSGSLEVRPR